KAAAQARVLVVKGAQHVRGHAALGDLAGEDVLDLEAADHRGIEKLFLSGQAAAQRGAPIAGLGLESGGQPLAGFLVHARLQAMAMAKPPSSRASMLPSVAAPPERRSGPTSAGQRPAPASARTRRCLCATRASGGSS